jgi:hypothetical protein
MLLIPPFGRNEAKRLSHATHSSLRVKEVKWNKDKRLRGNNRGKEADKILLISPFGRNEAKRRHSSLREEWDKKREKKQNQRQKGNNRGENYREKLPQ